MRELDVDVLATYHSHPTSPAVPSKKDLAARYGDGVVCVIVSLLGGAPEARAWWLGEDDFRETPFEVR